MCVDIKEMLNIPLKISSITGGSDPALESRDANLIDRDLLVLKSMQEKLHSTSHYVVADAYFAKNNFISGFARDVV